MRGWQTGDERVLGRIAEGVNRAGIRCTLGRESDSSRTGTSMKHDRDLRDLSEKSPKAYLASYLTIITFLFILNMVTSPGNWWWFWPALGMGIPMIGIFYRTIFKVEDDDHPEAQGTTSREASTPTQTHPESTAPSAQEPEIPTRGTPLVDRMRSTARRIPNPEIRNRVLGLCAKCDNSLSRLEELPDDQVLAHDFVSGLL